MPQFVVYKSVVVPGTGMTFDPAYPGVEIAFKPPARAAARQQGDGRLYVLTPPLASDSEIDIAVDRLKERLEAARSEAKRLLKNYQARAGTERGPRD